MFKYFGTPESGLFLSWDQVDSSADWLGAPVRELSALELRPVEHVSWIINTPDFEDVRSVISCFSDVIWTE